MIPETPEPLLALMVPASTLRAMLGALMSDESERCWFAGWLIGTEEGVPHAARYIARLTPGEYESQGVYGLLDTLGQWAFIPYDIAVLMCRIADTLGGWVDYDGNLYHPACDYKVSDNARDI